MTKKSINTRRPSRIILGGQRWLQDRMNPAKEQPLEHLRRPGPGPGQGPLLEAFLGQFDRLKRFVIGMGLNVSDAEDVLQDISVQVLRHAGRSKADSNPTAWLFAVTVNRVRLEHRRRGMSDKGTSGIIEKGPTGRSVDAQHQAMHDEEARIITEALDQMDDSIRIPLVLRYFCDQDSTRIAEVLGLPASTVRSRLRSGRLILARRLLEQGIEP